jgi:hypothetical protein
MSSQAVCKACLLLHGLNSGLPNSGVSRTRRGKKRQPQRPIQLQMETQQEPCEQQLQQQQQQPQPPSEQHSSQQPQPVDEQQQQQQQQHVQHRLQGLQLTAT